MTVLPPTPQPSRHPLYQTQILDISADSAFDDLAALATQICQTPIAWISFFQDDRQWFKSVIGLSLNWIEAPCGFLCQLLLQGTERVEIQDTQLNELWQQEALLPPELNIRFYASVPIQAPEGSILGSLSVLSYHPQKLTVAQWKGLQTISQQITAQVELRTQRSGVSTHCHQPLSLVLQEQPQNPLSHLVTIVETTTDLVGTATPEGQILYINESGRRMLQLPAEADFSDYHLTQLHPPHIYAKLLQEGIPTALQEGFWSGETALISQTGQEIPISQVILSHKDEQGQVRFLSTIARDISDHKQVEAELRERSQLALLMAEMGMALSQGGTLADTLEFCVNAIADHLRADFVRIWTLERETELLELQALVGQHSYTEEFPSRISLGISIVGFIAQTRQPYFSDRLLEDVCIGAQDWIQQEQFVTFAGLPLIVEDRLVGVLALFSRHSLQEPARSMLSWIANSLAIAIDRFLAREELSGRRESLLFNLANQIRNSLDLDTILGAAVSEIRSLLQIDRCYFLWCWPQPDQPVLAVTHEDCNAQLPSFLGDVPDDQSALMGQIIINQEVLRIDDVITDPDLEPELQGMLQEAGITSQLLLPLTTRSNQLGAIVCSHCSGPRIWLDSEMELLQAVTNQLAIAMEQAELYAQSRATALAAQSQAHQLSDALQHLQQTQSQLIQHEKMSSLGQMVAGVAHEINNPVNFINGNLVYASNYIHDLLELIELYQKHYPEPDEEILEKLEEIDLEFLSEDLLKLLSSMQIGGERIRQIVLSLRNFSRLDEAEMKPVDIHDGIDSTLLILQNRLKSSSTSSGVQIVKAYSELPKVECYAGQLNQVFMNILSNAIDAMEEQPAPHIITISTELLEQEDNPQVVIRFQDNGPGMPETVRAKLFDPFFTTKPVGKGTGLGLSISYQIVVEKHGGQLECLSEPGQGAEFRIQIPLQPPIHLRSALS